MPAAPILHRTLLYDKMPDGEFRLLDWCLVNTSVGACVEFRPPMPIDVVDIEFPRNLTYESFNAIQEFDEDQAYRLLGTGGGPLVPETYR